MSKQTNALNRRAFLQMTGAAAAGIIMTACVPAAPSESTGEEQAPDASANEVSLYMLVDPGELEPLTALVEEYNTQNAGSEILMEIQPWDGYAEKLVTMVAGGAGPDLSYMHPLWVSFLADQDVALPLDDLVDASPEFHPEDFFPEVAAYFLYKGKRYGFPHSSWPTVTYFNKTLFDQVGVPYPSEFQEGFADGTDEWTWDKLLELAVPLTTGEGPEKTFGLSPRYGAVPNSLSHLSQLIYSWGGEMWNENFTESRLCEEPAMAAIAFQADLIIQHHVAPLPAETEGIPGSVNTGRYAMWCWNRSEVPGFRDVEFELGMAPYPRGPESRTLRDGPSALMLNKHSRVTDPAWTFAKWFVGPEPGMLGGQRYQFETQHAQPARISLFNDPVFVDNLLPWESGDIYEDAGERTRAMAPPPRLQEIDGVWREQWERIVLADASVEEAVETFCTRANQMLQEAL